MTHDPQLTLPLAPPPADEDTPLVPGPHGQRMGLLPAAGLFGMGGRRVGREVGTRLKAGALMGELMGVGVACPRPTNSARR